jgi:predicted transcriptional regulator
MSHSFNANMCEKTFQKALRNLRKLGLIEQGIKGRMNSYTITSIPAYVEEVLH